MKKKIEIASEDTVKVDKQLAELIEGIKVENVSPLHIEFNNEGLNQLRDKLNEIIEFVNKWGLNR